MIKAAKSESRDNYRYENPRVEIELKPDQKVACRVKLPGGVAYVMGKVRHSFESEHHGTVAGISLDFFDTREKDRFSRRVDELKVPRRDYKTHQF